MTDFRDPAEMFKLRCEAKALLVNAYEVDRVDAADDLQRSAAESGLIQAIGQDAVQKIIVDALQKPVTDDPILEETRQAFQRTQDEHHGPISKPHWSQASWDEVAPEHEAPPLNEMPILKLDDWLERDLPEPDFLLGELLSTTSRIIINAPTGIGKTLFMIGMFMGMSAGLGFLRWPSRRPARTLFIDGEMSRRLLKKRLQDEAKRLGVCPKNMHVLSREDVETFAPLNTLEGHAMIKQVIEHLGGIDVVGFDNVMSLISGDMKDEEGWRQTLPLVHWLTRKGIGQVWVHHTGHDESRGYGTKTKEWLLDTVGHFEEIKRPDTDVSFQLTFPKARERTPTNRADFAERKVALLNDHWTCEAADGARKGKAPSPLTKKFYDALVNATIGNSSTKMFNCPSSTIEEWRAECFKISLLDRDKPDSARTLFSKHKLALIAANWIACNETMAWTLPN